MKNENPITSDTKSIAEQLNASDSISLTREKPYFNSLTLKATDG